MQTENKLEQIFRYQSHQVRTVLVDGQPWFVAADVCEILGMARQQDSTRHLDANDKKGCLLNTPMGYRTMVTVNEPGLYCLILRSRKPEARDFTRWVTHEVLPALRLTGGYQMPQEHFVEKKLVKFSRRELILLAIDAENECAELRGVVDDLAPKAEFYDRVADSGKSFSIGTTAKMLECHGFGRNNLIKFLRAQGVLMSDNVAMQRYVDRGYFHVLQKECRAKDGNIRISAVTRVYEKGVDFIRRLLDQAFPEGRDGQRSRQESRQKNRQVCGDASVLCSDDKLPCNAVKHDKVTGRFSA